MLAASQTNQRVEGQRVEGQRVESKRVEGQRVEGQRVEGPPIFVISGSTGATGELLTHTVLAQFRDVHVPIHIEAHVHEPQQVIKAVAKAAAAGGIIVHTMVNAGCRKTLVEEAQQKQICAFDLSGPLLDHLAQQLGQPPIGQPGLYRQLRAAYYQRIDAINFSVAHDDGQRVAELPLADLVLLGVSRVGKTPLSMYLAMLGWKVANVPLVIEVPPPKALFEVDRQRVFGLMIEPTQLMMHRRTRQSALGVTTGPYFDRQNIAEELRAANRLFYQHGFTVINVTDKPIESSGDEIITILSRLVG